MKKTIFTPGCALILYKPYLVEKLFNYLKSKFENIDLLVTCCRNKADLSDYDTLINICPGCDKRYRENYDNLKSITFPEILCESDDFPFPDYKNEKMTIIDACPTRDQDRIHESIRILAEKMNISIIEPSRTKKKSTCCGDSFYGTIETSKVIDQMKKKAKEMPLDNILVYCVSCCKSMFNGGKQPRYLMDLLFSEDTTPNTINPDVWHKQLDEFIEKHKQTEIVDTFIVE